MDGVLGLLWIVLMLGAFYALLLRPQRRNMAADTALTFEKLLACPSILVKRIWVRRGLQRINIKRHRVQRFIGSPRLRQLIVLAKNLM